MARELTTEDCEFILSCLEYTRLAYESAQYQTYEERRSRLDSLSAVQEKLRRIRDGYDSES